MLNEKFTRKKQLNQPIYTKYQNQKTDLTIDIELHNRLHFTWQQNVIPKKILQNMCIDCRVITTCKDYKTIVYYVKTITMKKK